MIRRAAAAILVIVAPMIGLAAASTATAATNLVSNPGFEAGTLSGWTCSPADSVVGSPVHSGSHALAGGATSSDDAQCSQVIPVQPSSSYALSAWVEGSYVYLGDNGTGTSDTSTWTPSASAWQQLSTTFSTGASTTSVTIDLHGWYGQGTYYADDVTLTGPGGSPPASPPVPSGLTVTGVTASSASLSWTEAGGSDAAASYDVYENGSLAQSASTTSATVTGLAPGTSYQFTVAAVDASGNSSAQSTAVSATTSGSGPGGGTSGNWRSPVYLMPLDNNPPSASQIAGIMSATGEKDFMLSFVLDSGGCTPAWDGSSSELVASDTTVAALVSAIRAAGGDAGVSFGGYNGTELGQDCASASALASAYQSVISKYQLTHVDFDIENTALGDTGNELKRAQAIALLEQEDPGLTVSLTIPMTSVGLPGTGTGEIQQAIAAGARIDVFGIEDFDYGLTSGTQVSSDETVASDVASQLESLYGWPAATAWARIGITLMNGHTDQPSELFTQATFTSLLGFAQASHVAWLSFWSLNRDQPCPAGVQEAWAPGTCSNISQSPYDFTKIVAQYAG
ncbi:MAG TPA: carbohydrate binding domain-containing protein [Trebonia sp.]|nr:carbohydrate binding domain-containing protein [Trebonia sp.]